MTDKLELKSSHEVVYTVYAADVESIFYCKPDDPDILTVLMKDGKRLYCDEVCPIDSLQEEPVEFKIDKEKFRGKVEKLKSNLIHGACSSQIAMETRCKEEAYNEVLAILDTMQEEPVSNDFEMALAEMIGKAQTSVVEPWVFAAQWKDELIKLAKSEEPVSEDLGDYINELSKQFTEVSFAKLSRIAVRVAKWQKEQDQSTIELAEDHAMLAGMEKMKEEMMARAIDAELYSDGMFTPLISVNDKEKISDVKFGDKVKVVLLKK